jgi:sulfur relay (sulfurtransferase) DsrC/TusE family protein
LDGFKTAERKLKGINISETFGDVSAEAANALADIATNTGWGGTNNFVKAFQQAQGSLLTTSDKNQFAALMGSMEGKETLREAWEDLETDLKEQNLWNEEVAKFIATSIEKTSATYSEAHLAAIGVSDELYSRYQQAVISGNEEVVDNFHKTFKKWKQDYDVANDEGRKAEHELKTAISDALTKSAEEEIDKLQALTDAVNEANERMVQAIQKQIDE